MLNKIKLYILILFSLPSFAQTPKDYSFIKERNVWLTSNSGAALTTFNDSNVTKGGAYFSRSKCDECNASKLYSIETDVESFFRLSPKTVVSGGIAYKYAVDKEHCGTAFTSNEDIHPFDIIISCPATVKTEEISLSGAIGWQAMKNISIGAKAEYSTANSARQKDLRYANFRMDFATSVGIFTSFPAWGEAAISFFYRRTTESLAFSRAGTTDAVHTSLIDYGNGIGINETYSGEGFTDDTEQPLFSEYKGLSAQFNIPITSDMSLFIDGLYAHRSGYYGKLSQYTIRHTEHKSDCYSIHSRLYFPSLLGRSLRRDFNFIDAQISIENLTALRTNYLAQTTERVTCYTYYAPTKTANKVQATGHVAYISHFNQWRLSLGTRFLHRKQTAWLYPKSSTVTDSQWYPFATIQRCFPLKNKVLLTPRLAISTTSIDYGISVSF